LPRSWRAEARRSGSASKRRRPLDIELFHAGVCEKRSACRRQRIAATPLFANVEEPGEEPRELPASLFRPLLWSAVGAVEKSERDEISAKAIVHIPNS
jgi:hypothetical protein